MVSKNEIRLITSLSQKKYRKKHQLFVAEGVKLVEELVLFGFNSHQIYATDLYQGVLEEHLCKRVTDNELQKLSNLHEANSILGVFAIPTASKTKTKGLTVVLDAVKDPGNLGTIIRLCDWFGVAELICSTDTVDCYNPKVVQATMGSIARVKISYLNIEAYLNETDLPIYVSLLEGQNVYQSTLPNEAILIMGNEANGVQDRIQKLAKNRITIPSFNKHDSTESLNVATATAVLLSEFRR